MTRSAIFILLTLQLWTTIRMEMHAKHLDERAENLNGKVFTMLDTSSRLLHHVSPKHPHNALELKVRGPVMGCPSCHDLAKEREPGL